MQKRYNDLATHLRTLFGCRVQKISVDAGLSCPNRDGHLATGGCIYCNSRGSGTGAHRAGLSISAQLAAGKQALARRYGAEKFIAYFQAFSNTYAPVEVLKALYDEALAVPGIVGLSIGTRPDCVTAPVLDLLAGYARQRLVWVEYGLQSARDETLVRIHRGHDAGCFFRAVELTRNRGIRICAHVILGLPGETRADMLYTADRLADAEFHRRGHRAAAARARLRPSAARSRRPGRRPRRRSTAPSASSGTCGRVHRRDSAGSR